MFRILILLVFLVLAITNADEEYEYGEYEYVDLHWTMKELKENSDISSTDCYVAILMETKMRAIPVPTMCPVVYIEYPISRF